MAISNAFKFANNILTNGGYDAADLVGAVGGGASAFRNIVINGDMSIAQRATTKVGIGFEYGTVDRWQTVQGNLGAFTQSQSTDVPTGEGFAKSLKMDCTTADASPASGDELYIRQLFEGQNLQYLKKGTANAVSLTASFWVKSTKTGTFIVELVDDDNLRSISKSYTVNTTNTWEKKTITFDGDTTGAFTNDNGQSLNLDFWLGAGTGATSGTLATTWGAITTANRAVGQVNIADDTANDWYITGVQLEAGISATDFEFLPIDVNLGRCCRYFWASTNDIWVFGNAANFGGAASVALNNIKYPVRMRTSPSISHGTAGNNEAVRRGSSTGTFTIAGVQDSGADSLNLTIYNGGGGLSWSYTDAYTVSINNFIANAEL
jgi:hypothetical protein